MRKSTWILCALLIFGTVSLSAAETRAQCEEKCKLLGCKSCCMERARNAMNACTSTAWNEAKACGKKAKTDPELKKCEEAFDAALKTCPADVVDITKAKCENPKAKY